MTQPLPQSNYLGSHLPSRDATSRLARIMTQFVPRNETDNPSDGQVDLHWGLDGTNMIARLVVVTKIDATSNLYTPHRRGAVSRGLLVLGCEGTGR